jgi:hypothetical protein
MKSSRLYIIFSALALTVSLTGQVVLAQPEKGGSAGKSAGQSEPSAADLAKSKDRGLIFMHTDTGVGAGGTVQPIPLNTSVVKPTIKPAVKPTAVKPNQTKTAKTATHHQVKTASSQPAKVTKHVADKDKSKEDTSANVGSPTGESGAVTVSHQVVTGGSAVVKAWLNKQGNDPQYKVGEKMTINVQASEDCNLVVFDFDGKNNLKQIFPNQYQANGLLKAGGSISIGGADSPFDYQVGGAGGQERIFVYAYPASTGSSPLTVAMLPTPHSPFRSAELTLDQYRDLVNKSKVFFSREVKIIPKKGVQQVADTTTNAPNKIELTFHVQP